MEMNKLWSMFYTIPQSHFIVAFAPWLFVFVFVVFLSEISMWLSLSESVVGVKLFLLWIGVIVCIVCLLCLSINDFLLWKLYMIYRMAMLRSGMV